MKTFWNYKNEYKHLRKNILKSIDRVLSSGQIFFGNELNKFENNFNKLNKSRYGLAVGSGTEALYIALKSFGIGYGDEVITVSNTAIPTASAITSTGAKIKFVDINEDYLIDPEQIEKKINNKTKAIIPVHLYGQSCDMDKINKIAKKNKLKIIEDCAQAQGATYKKRHVGTMGDAGCFSFYPTKILGAYGDGGFITVKSKKIYEKMRRIRFYGIEGLNKKNKFFGKYYSNEQGVNSRIDEMQLSILNIKLLQVNKYIKKRIKIANYYRNKLKNTSLVLPNIRTNNKHVFHLFTVYHNKRDLILKKLRKLGIKINIYYPYPVHKMKGYRFLNKNKKLELRITEKMSQGIFSLPLYPEITSRDLEKITNSLKSILKSI
tara:strand:+ start:3933 stop:5063 length:1131 start_codon:yes stop_codon:yes gene_type:complete